MNDSSTNQSPERIAVIGAGISGLTTAYLLHQHYDVTVFEANDYIGGHTHTIPVYQNGRTYNVDTGFIVFNDRTYPRFMQLLKKLDVAYQPSSMSFSVRNDQSGIEYRATNLNTFFAQRRNLFRPSMYRLIHDILRFKRELPAIVQTPDYSLTLGAYLEQQRYSAFFISHFIIPMGAAIWSSSTKTMQDFPLHFFARFFYNHGFLEMQNQPQWFVIQGGSSKYIEPLIAGFRDRIMTASPVACVCRLPEHVEIQTRDGRVFPFDKIIIATHSDQALRMLGDPSDAEKRILGGLPYQANATVLHTDTTLMPHARRAWASWNYHVNDSPNQPASVSYNMNILQTLSSPEQFMVTLNHTDAVNPGHIIREFTYHHPVFTPEGAGLQSQQQEINGVNRTWFCGAYWRYGFHEDGVISALNVCHDFDVKLEE